MVWQRGTNEDGSPADWGTNGTHNVAEVSVYGEKRYCLWRLKPKELLGVYATKDEAKEAAR